MGKAPAFQFYPGDWWRDVQVQMASLHTKGFWFEMLLHMHDAPERGKIEGTKEQISRLMFCSNGDLEKALREIITLKIGDVFIDGIQVDDAKNDAKMTDDDKKVTIINRRMFKEFQDKKNHNLRQLKYKLKKVSQSDDAKDDSKMTLHSSSSSSSSNKNTTESSSEFESFWKAYPKRKNRGQAERAWSKIHPDEVLFAKMLAVIEALKKTDGWVKEKGKFIPYPATWLNAKGWEDEIECPKTNSW